MWRSSVTIDETIALLNELAQIDQDAMYALIEQRVPCTDRLAYHETVQVKRQNGAHYVGMLGILNGLFGVDDDGRGPITAYFEFEANGKLKSLVFKKTAGQEVN